MFGTLTANTKHAINRLVNGGFYRVVTPVGDDSIAFDAGGNQVPPDDPTAVLTYPFTRFLFEDGDNLAPTLTVVEERPNETLLAGWYIYGVDGQVDVRPLDPVLNVPIRGIYGPTPARFTLQETGEMTVEQVLDDPKWWGLLDREITLSFVALRGNSSLTLSVEVDYGTETVELFSRSTRSFTRIDQVVLSFTPPSDATQFVLRWKLNGSQDASAYIGEAMLQLGNIPRPKFTDDISTLGRPRGMVYFFNGETPPPGFVTDCDVEGKFMFPTAGDAQTSGLEKTRVGGDDTHDHGGVTSTRIGTTDVEKDNSGGSKVNRQHRHTVNDAQVDPPWYKVLIIQKV